jgi:Transposase
VADKRRIVEETGRPGASLSEVARSYGITARVLFRWKLELAQAAPVFVAVEITDAIPRQPSRIDRLCITCCSPSQPSHQAGCPARSRLRRQRDGGELRRSPQS